MPSTVGCFLFRCVLLCNVSFVGLFHQLLLFVVLCWFYGAGD